MDLAKKAVDVALDKQAGDILLLDLRGLCGFADYFVICSAESSRQIQAIIDAVDEALGQEGLPARRREGSVESGWVLLDFGDFMVHVFAPQQRQFYGLERLWGKAAPLVRIQ